MNKYIYSECYQDSFPEIKLIVAKNYNVAVEKLIKHYVDKFEDDNRITILETIDDLQEHLNEVYDLVISDLYDIEDFE